MNKVGFMSQLEGLLADIPAAEKEEALQYYNDYFEDAGEENEENVIQSLGSPQTIAENIKAEIRGEDIPHSAKAADHAITKYGQIVEIPGRKAEEPEGEAKEPEGEFGEPWKDRPEDARTIWQKLPGWAIAVIIIIAVCVIPELVAAFLGILGTMIGLIAAWFGIILAVGGTAFGLFAAAVILFVVGTLCIPISPMVFIAVLGASFICASFGLLATMLAVWMGGKATPAIFRGIGFVWKKMVGLIKKFFAKIK